MAMRAPGAPLVRQEFVRHVLVVHVPREGSWPAQGLALRQQQLRQPTLPGVLHPILPWLIPRTMKSSNVPPRPARMAGRNHD